MNALFENETMVFVSLFILSACIFAVVLYLAVQQRRKLLEYFEIFAQKIGCPANIPEGFFGGLPSLNGVYRKRSLRVYMFKRSSGSGKNRRTTTYTAFTLEVANPDALVFHIYEQGFFSTLLTKFGAQDIQIGDEAFDKEFMIKGNNEEKVRGMLTPMIMSKFMDFAERYTAFGIQLKGDQFYYEAPVTISSERSLQRFEEMINFMCDIADQLDEMNRRRRN